MDEFLEQYAETPKRQRYLGFAAAILALLAGYYYFFYSAQAERLEDKRESYETIARDMSRQRGFLDNLARYEARLNELKQNLRTARMQLPEDPDVPQLLAQLGNKARQAGIEIDEFNPRGEKKRDFYAEIGFDVTVRGSYHEVAHFVDAVGKLDRIVNVSNISLREPESVNQKIVLSGALTVKTYRYLGNEKKAKK
mgnify:CR=1 FL=1